MYILQIIPPPQGETWFFEARGKNYYIFGKNFFLRFSVFQRKGGDMIFHYKGGGGENMTFYVKNTPLVQDFLFYLLHHTRA